MQSSVLISSHYLIHNSNIAAQLCSNQLNLKSLNTMYDSSDAINNSGCILISSSILQNHTYPNLQRERRTQRKLSLRDQHNHTQLNTTVWFTKVTIRSTTIRHTPIIRRNRDEFYYTTNVQNSVCKGCFYNFNIFAMSLALDFTVLFKTFKPMSKRHTLVVIIISGSKCYGPECYW